MRKVEGSQRRHDKPPLQVRAQQKKYPYDFFSLSLSVSLSLPLSTKMLQNIYTDLKDQDPMIECHSAPVGWNIFKLFLIT